MPSSDGYKNLIPLNKQSKERQREIQRMGNEAMKAKAKAEKQHKQEVRTLAEIANALMQKMIKNEKTGEETSTKQVIVAGLLAKAARGDTKAFEIVAKLLGETLADKVELTGANGQPLTSSTYITPESLEEIKKHIADTIKDV